MSSLLWVQSTQLWWFPAFPTVIIHRSREAWAPELFNHPKSILMSLAQWHWGSILSSFDGTMRARLWPRQPWPYYQGRIDAGPLSAMVCRRSASVSHPPVVWPSLSLWRVVRCTRLARGRQTPVYHLVSGVRGSHPLPWDPRCPGSLPHRVTGPPTCQQLTGPRSQSAPADISNTWSGAKLGGPRSLKQTRYLHPMTDWCWASVYDAGPTIGLMSDIGWRLAFAKLRSWPLSATLKK